MSSSEASYVFHTRASSATHSVPELERSDTRSLTAIWIMAAVGIITAARLMWWYWPGSVFESATSGTWAALAWDFAHGEFYRPVLADTGYGGTRYMPGLIVAYGLLLRAHVDPVIAGVVLMQLSVVAACAALCLALRSGGAPRSASMAFALTPFGTVLYQKYFTDIRVDYFAAAAVLLAFAAAATGVRRRSSRWFALSAIACLIGGLMKLTAFAFVLPIAGWLALSWSRTTARRFLLWSTTAFAAMLYAIDLASSGRFLTNVHATLTEGMTLADIWRVGLRSLFQEIVTDPFIAAPLVLAVWSAFALWRDRHARLFVAYLATALAVTTVILASPGTASNHMVDLQLAATLVIGVAMTHNAVPARLTTAVYVTLAAVLTLLTVPIPYVPSVMATVTARGPHHRSTIEQVHAEFLAGSGPYLSSDPLVPVLSGDRAYAVDSFFLDVSLRRRTAPGLDMIRRIENRYFNTVVLRDADVFPRDMNPADPDFARGSASYFAKGGVLTTLVHSGYDIYAVRKPFVILRPRAPQLTRLAIREGNPVPRVTP